MAIMKSAKNVVMTVAAFALLLGSSTLAEDLGYHRIKTDSNGHIAPWYSDDPATSYDFAIRRVWEFWRDMKTCPNGVKYYMQHQVWADPGEDSRGLGGDQISMALSSWALLYPYLGDRDVVQDMTYMADHWLDHGISRPQAAWPNLPFPYNTELHSGVYDGDMRAGKGYLQPDKAASFGAELVPLYQLSGDQRYLKAATAIADTLVAKMEDGDGDRSPWPYRVHAETGQVSMPYTANYTGALRLFEGLVALDTENRGAYAKAHDRLTAWLKAYPLQTNKWGPFFEDITGWSNTEINADTMAWYILEHPSWDPRGYDHARRILSWSRAIFANPAWKRYGLNAINEQTAYPVPGNSHTSRHASVQLLYAAKTRDLSLKSEAIRQLNWATYMVGEKGNNRYSLDDIWLTDGYGDYVRHYLRSMAAAPELSPRDQDHLLQSSSVVRSIKYAPGSIVYETFDQSAEELLRLSFEPKTVTAGGVQLRRLRSSEDLKAGEGFTYNAAGDVAGVVRIRHTKSGNIAIAGPLRPNVGPTSKSDTRAAEEEKVRLGSRTYGRTYAGDQAVRVPQNGSAEIRLVAREVDATGSIFAVSPPSHGKLSGTAPFLVYTARPGYIGTDAFSFVASKGDSESRQGLVTIEVFRPNLATSPASKAFALEKDSSGESGRLPLPALNDGDVATGIQAGSQSQRARQVAVCVVWDKAQPVRQVVFHQGLVDASGGSYGALPRLRITDDGTTWREAPGCSVFPAVYPQGSAASLAEYLFTLPEAVSCRGIQLAGELGGTQPGASTCLRVRELEVFRDLGSNPVPQIEHTVASTSVAEGQTAVIGVRMRTPGFYLFQWQESVDGGQTWSDLTGGRGPYLAVNAARQSEYDGRQYRCAFSDGISPVVFGRPVTLKVAAPGSQEIHGSNQPLK